MRADVHDGPGHNTLQSEAGYIDARPQSRQIDETSCDARPDHTFGSKCEELKVRKASLQYRTKQTLFGRCEKFRRRAMELNRSRGRMLGRSRSRLIEVADGCVLS